MVYNIAANRRTQATSVDVRKTHSKAMIFILDQGNSLLASTCIYECSKDKKPFAGKKAVMDCNQCS